jgi:hypothetical protein
MQHPGHVAFRREQPEDDKVELAFLQFCVDFGSATALVGEEAKILERFRKERPNVRLAVDNARMRSHSPAAKLKWRAGVEMRVFHLCCPFEQALHDFGPG